VFQATSAHRGFWSSGASAWRSSSRFSIDGWYFPDLMMSSRLFSGAPRQVVVDVKLEAEAEQHRRRNRVDLGPEHPA
jgi:hypothetical protein